MLSGEGISHVSHFHTCCQMSALLFTCCSISSLLQISHVRSIVRVCMRAGKGATDCSEENSEQLLRKENNKKTSNRPLTYCETRTYCCCQHEQAVARSSLRRGPDKLDCALFGFKDLFPHHCVSRPCLCSQFLVNCTVQQN